MDKDLSRRNLLKLSAASSLIAASPLGQATTPQMPSTLPQNIKKYPTLGRTNLKISDIFFGSSQLRQGEESLVKHAFDQGVNYFDTADSYTGGVSESVIGNALKGQRDKETKRQSHYCHQN